jgi:hypothetical protein
LSARAACRTGRTEQGRGRLILRGAGGTGRKAGFVKRVGGVRTRVRQGFFRNTLRGRSPREHPVAGVLILHRLPGTPGRVKAQKPKPVGPAHCFSSGNTGGRNGTWVLPRGNAADTFREEKAPKGESHERRRCETEPARARREQPAKRVAKPCRRNVAGGRARVMWTSVPCMCCREPKPTRGVQRLRPAG